jgi:hypothetical protein
MPRRSILGKVDTGTILLIGGVAIVGLYLLSRPATIPGYVPAGPGGALVPNYGGYPYSPANTTAQDIQAGGSALSNVLNILGNQGVIGS